MAKAVIKNTIHKLLLPFFPENPELVKHWWHKLAKLITIITSICSIYSIVWLTAIFFIIPARIINSPSYHQIYNLSYIPAYLPLNFTSFLSQFSVYGFIFRLLLPVPVIGPLSLIYILILFFYISPSLIYRIAIFISGKFYMKRVKIVVALFFFIVISFIFSALKLQQLVSEGSIIADNQCLKVNPLIIDRKNSYLASIEILQASGSAKDYWTETNKYLDISQKFTNAQNAWLKEQKAFIDRWDFQIFMPSYIKDASKAQYLSRDADMKAQEALYEAFKTKNTERQNELSKIVIDQTKISTEAQDEYNKIWDAPKMLDFRTQFINVPKSKCPANNFNIPDIYDFFHPNAKPMFYGQPLT